MARLIIIGLAVAMGIILAGPGKSQTNPGFNPDLSWCNIQGSLAVRGPSKWQCLTPGTAGQSLLSGGSGALPYWNTVTGTGTVTNVNGSGGTTGLTLTGGPITGAGTLTLGGTLAIANGGTGGTGAANTVFRSNGTTNAFGQIVNGDITPGTITNSAINASAAIDASKLASQPSLTVIANTTGGAAVPTTPTVTALLDAAFSSTQGSILYRNVSGWSALPPGTAGYYLQTTGGGGNPLWSPVAGGPGVGSVVSVTCGTGLTGGTITTSGTCTIDAGNVPGVANNSNAGAGIVGEYIESVLPSPGNTQGSAGGGINITAISLTAGDWDISGTCYYLSPGNSSFQNCSISSVANTPTTVVGANTTMGAIVSGLAFSNTVGPHRVSLNSTQTYYLVGLINAASPGQVYGVIRARRMR